MANANENPVTVDYTAIDGSAQAGLDYAASSGTLTLSAADPVEIIEVAILDDYLVEGDETFTVELSNPSGATIVTASANDEIVDNDPEPSAPPVSPPIAHDDGMDASGNYTYSTHSAPVSLSGSVGANDVYYGSTQTFEITNYPMHGSVDVQADGQFTYTPYGDYEGVDSFSYKFTGESSDYTYLVSNDATVFVELTNTAPEAVDDYYQVISGGWLSVPYDDGLLANDVDGDGDALSVVNVTSKTDPPLGLLNVNSDGSFDYYASGDVAGPDVYTYHAYDGIAQSDSPASVTINVIGVAIDIAGDSNHDGFVDARDEAVEEQPPGVFFPVQGELVDIALTREFLDELNSLALGESALAGDLAGYSMTLQSADGSKVQLWEDGAETNAIDFGQYVYDGINARPQLAGQDLPDLVYAEGLQRGETTLELTFNDAYGSPILHDWLVLTVFDVDLDIDSNNDGGLSPPADDPSEDLIEDDPAYPGKYITVHDRDYDFDFVPDYADGSLDLEHTRISDAALRQLNRLKHLRRLNLSRTHVGDATLKTLAVCDRLQRLDMSHTHVSDEGLRTLSVMTCLEQLDLGGTRIDGLGLAAIKNHPRIQWLNLRDTKVVDSALVHLNGLPALGYLDLSHTRVTDVGLRHLGKLPKLDSLYLSGLDITDDGVGYLCQLGTVTRLYLDDARVTDKGVRSLRALPRLTALRLARTQVSDAAATDLSSMGGLSSLALDSTHVTDASLREFAKLKRLRHLSVCDTSESAKPLAKVYVKGYARMKDGSVRFYKDGYTDLRGRFDYTSLNTNDLDYVDKFSLLILSDEHGAVVREAASPKR